jgi:GT2 family glycosyltransferase
LVQKIADRISFEIIVADNNSNDNTKDVVEEFRDHFKDQLVYSFEPKQGNSYARNSGIKIARGRIISFTDDDCTVQDDWIANIVKIFETSKTQVMVGKIILATPIPKNLSYSESFIQERFAHVDYGDEGFLEGKDIVGANSHFLSKVFKEYGEFNTDEAFNVNQDTEFSRRLEKQGVKIFYSPDVVVFHHFFPERFQEKRLFKQAFYFGRSSIYLDFINDTPVRNFLFCIKLLIQDSFKKLFLRNREDIFAANIRLYTNWGRCYERIRTKFKVVC